MSLRQTDLVPFGYIYGGGIALLIKWPLYFCFLRSHPAASDDGHSNWHFSSSFPLSASLPAVFTFCHFDVGKCQMSPGAVFCYLSASPQTLKIE